MFHCQVCGREIKAGSGLIAHHGYQRPGDGWQTDSCMGARYVPYEKSCDRLREVAVYVKNYIEKQEAALADHIANPPASITITERRSSWDKEGTKKTYTKPETFSDYKRNMPRTYEYHYDDQERAFKQSISSAKSDLAIMERRIQEWKPVTD